jgi:hypothetical protein
MLDTGMLGTSLNQKISLLDYSSAVALVKLHMRSKSTLLLWVYHKPMMSRKHLAFVQFVSITVFGLNRHRRAMSRHEVQNTEQSVKDGTDS